MPNQLFQKIQAGNDDLLLAFDLPGRGRDFAPVFQHIESILATSPCHEAKTGGVDPPVQSELAGGRRCRSCD